MPIHYLENSKTFVMESTGYTYAMGVDDEDVLVHIYYGSRIKDYEKLYIKHRARKEWQCWPSCKFEYMPEYPDKSGLTYEESCIDAEFSDLVRDVQMKYMGYAIEKDNGNDILKITLKDIHYNLEVLLIYTVYSKVDLIGKSSIIKNTGTDNIKLHCMKSGVMYLPYGREYEIKHMEGNWGKEYQSESSVIPHGKTIFETRRGSSAGPNHVPFFAVYESGKAGETFGEVWYGVLHWSGNFKIVAEKNQADMVSVTAGVNEYCTEIELLPNEKFNTPQLTIGYSENGFEKISESLYDFQLDVIIPRAKAYDIRPILYNSWYPYQFNVNRDNMLALIEKCKNLGIELFVIDDGWMKNRKDDTAGLGDWYADTSKFPNGIKEISDAAHKNGMKFGLWYEPEMVTESSDLYKQHPDWVLSYNTREKTKMRNQYVLNMANDDVMEFVWQTSDRLISEYNLDYIKSDMNRYISEAGFVGGTDKQQHEVYVRFTQNLYKVCQRLNEKYPNVLFECCAHGGARTDFGMVQYSDRINRSDNSDPVDVLKLHEGFSYLFLPKMAGGAGNMSASPNNMHGRVTPIEYRAHVGMLGAMSIGINLLKCSDEELLQIKNYIDEFKKIRPITHDAYVYRLSSILEKPYSILQYVKRDRTKSVIFAFGNNLNWNQRLPYIKLRGLKPEGMYNVEGYGIYSGEMLMKEGIEIKLKGDYSSKLIVINEC